MNITFSLLLVIYAQVNGPMPTNYAPPVIDKFEMRIGMSEEQCASMMLEIQDQISPESNIEYICQSESVDRNGFIKTIYPN
ncbi:hypothetical protein vBAbaPP1_180 [Acinetobacter phage vB_AbaM_P1]|nr:hypothetical protein vBAbaPP1_180 [Acinetobacter phage vB_AbaM_P1]WAX22661.1 hypothetical protein [Acinetobacter phage vB_AbaP_HB01]